jgi:hypothetical protein
MQNYAANIGTLLKISLYLRVSFNHISIIFLNTHFRFQVFLRIISSSSALSEYMDYNEF